jgi:glycolate oxidase
VSELVAIAGEKWVYTDEHELRTYESDGLLQYHAIPAAAVLPGSAEEVAGVVAACARAGVPWVARGAGSGLSGGALPISDGILIVLSRLKRILEIDLDNQRVCVEPGVTNASVSAAVAPPPARSCARSGATWPRTRAARTASSTASRPTT